MMFSRAIFRIGRRSITVKRSVVSRSRALRSVTTWSALASAFNTKPARKPNFSFTKGSAGLFNIPELCEPDGFYLLKERVIHRTDELVEECCSQTRKRKMVEIFDDLSDTLCQVADLAEFIRIAHPQSKYSMAAEDAAVAITSLVEKLNTNKSLYDALKAVVEEGDSVPTDEVDNHVAKLFLVDFEQSGIHLDKNKRKKIVELNDFALHLGSSFMHYCHVPRSVPKNKLPQNMHNMFTTEGQNVIISSLYSDSPLETVREAAYRIYLYPDSHQEELLHRLLSTRQELAELCGFPSFSHRALRGSLAEKPSTVMAFLNKLADEVRAPAQVNFDALAGVKKLKNPQSQDLKPWDIAYFSALLKNNKFRVNVNELSPFFSLGACMDGLNYLFGELYNIQLKVEEPHFGETWSPDVYKLAVVHEKEGLLGYLYCDFFEREKKPNQDCHFTIRGGRQLADGTYQLPVVVLLLNFPQPSWSVPSLLTPGMVENLFHEMGHAMHSMLARTKYQHVTGIVIRFK